MKKLISVGLSVMTMANVQPVFAHEAASTGGAHTVAHIVIGFAVLVCIAIAVKHTKTQRG